MSAEYLTQNMNWDGTWSRKTQKEQEKAFHGIRGDTRGEIYHGSQ